MRAFLLASATAATFLCRRAATVISQRLRGSSFLPATLSTDDRTVSALTLTGEYARALATLKLTLPELWRLDRHALEVAFLHHDEVVRADLSAAFEAFAAAEPALLGPGQDA